MSAGNAILPPRPGTAWSEARETKQQIGRFVVVGILCVSVDWFCYMLLYATFHVQRDAAKGLSYFAGVCAGFALNKLWTFRSARRSLSEPALYLAVYGVTLLVNMACNWSVLWLLPQQRALAFLVATAVSTVLNFLGLRLVAFRRGVAERREVHTHTLRRAA